MDHMKFLGNTLKEIALEKAGIIKENTTVVIGKTQKEIKELFTDIAKEKKAKEEKAPQELLKMSKIAEKMRSGKKYLTETEMTNDKENKEK